MKQTGDAMTQYRRVDRLFEIVHGIVTTVLVAWAGWVTLTLMGLLVWQGATDSNRFTAQDGEEVWAAIHQLQYAQPDPPKWFVDRMDRLENRLDTIEDRLRNVENSWKTMEARPSGIGTIRRPSSTN